MKEGWEDEGEWKDSRQGSVDTRSMDNPDKGRTNAEVLRPTHRVA